MKYFNYDLEKELPQQMCNTLQRYFDDTFGVSTVLPNLAGDVEIVVIDRVVKVSKSVEDWTHYANIIKQPNGTWQVSESFIKIDDRFCDKWGEEYRRWVGTEQTAVYIYGYYKTFTLAVKNLKLKGNSENKRTVIDVYV